MQCNSILIVEDDRDIREAIELALHDAGYFVFTAAHGKSAQELLKKIPGPCLVFLDLMMPLVSGWDFISQADQQKVSSGEQSSFLVVVITALPAGLGCKTPVLSTAAIDSIRKPFDLDQFLDIVGQHCKPAHATAPVISAEESANLICLDDWAGKSDSTQLLRA